MQFSCLVTTRGANLNWDIKASFPRLHSSLSLDSSSPLLSLCLSFSLSLFGPGASSVNSYSNGSGKRCSTVDFAALVPSGRFNGGGGGRPPPIDWMHLKNSENFAKNASFLLEIKNFLRRGKAPPFTLSPPIPKFWIRRCLRLKKSTLWQQS